METVFFLKSSIATEALGMTLAAFSPVNISLDLSDLFHSFSLGYSWYLAVAVVVGILDSPSTKPLHLFYLFRSSASLDHYPEMQWVDVVYRPDGTFHNFEATKSADQLFQNA